MKKLINFFKIKKLLLNSNGENSYNFFYVEEPNDKKNTFNRVQYIADKIWTIQRGIWVEYFKKYPKDLPKVLKKTQSQGYKSILKQDVRKNYRNLGFNQKLCDWIIWQIENGYFGKYVKLNTLAKLNYDLSCITIFENNPYGLNEKWKDGSIHSTGVKLK